ncbi:MAG TPA: PDZ domain-containing protein [Planctomycetia bacterium]|nr:PDZ domain-containing protein [Planctomycetia bacterium]
MLIAIVSKMAVAAACAAALSDEPVKEAFVLPGAEMRFTQARRALGDVTVNGAGLELAGASSTPIGIDVKAVDAPLKAHLKLDFGAMVARVVPESDAAKSGIKVHDIVLRVEGKPVPNVAWLRTTLEDPKLGKKASDDPKEPQVATLELVREAKPIKVQLRLAPKPRLNLTAKAYIDLAGEQLISKSAEVKGQGQHYRLGVALAEADEVLRSQLKLANGEGLVVTQVAPDSPAAKAGVAKNDVIIMFDRAPAKDVNDLTRRVQKLGDKPAVMVLRRAGEELKVAVEPKKEVPAKVSVELQGDVNVDTATQLKGEFTEIISDLIILTDKEGKAMTVTGKPTKDFVVTSPKRAEIVDFVVAGQPQPGIAGEIKALRQAVDQLQSTLARLEKKLDAGQGAKAKK